MRARMRPDFGGSLGEISFEQAFVGVDPQEVAGAASAAAGAASAAGIADEALDPPGAPPSEPSTGPVGLS